MSWPSLSAESETRLFSGMPFEGFGAWAEVHPDSISLVQYARLLRPQPIHYATPFFLLEK
jgi:hypothetical protein